MGLQTDGRSASALAEASKADQEATLVAPWLHGRDVDGDLHHVLRVHRLALKFHLTGMIPGRNRLALLVSLEDCHFRVMEEKGQLTLLHCTPPSNETGYGVPGDFNNDPITKIIISQYKKSRFTNGP